MCVCGCLLIPSPLPPSLPPLPSLPPSLPPSLSPSLLSPSLPSSLPSPLTATGTPTNTSYNNNIDTFLWSFLPTVIIDCHADCITRRHVSKEVYCFPQTQRGTKQFVAMMSLASGSGRGDTWMVQRTIARDIKLMFPLGTADTDRCTSGATKTSPSPSRSLSHAMSSHGFVRYRYTPPCSCSMKTYWVSLQATC